MEQRPLMKRTLDAVFVGGLIIGLASFLQSAQGGILYFFKFVPPLIFLGLTLSSSNIRFPGYVIGAWWVWMGVLVASISASHDLGSSVALVLSYLVFSIYTSSLARVYRNRVEFMQLIVFLACAGIVVLSLIVVDSDSAWTAYQGRLRFRGGFYNPNFLGQVCAMGIYAGVRFMVHARLRLVARLLVVLGIVGLSVPLYLSDSRGALMFVSLGIVGVLAWPRKWLLVGLGACSLSFLLLYANPLPRNLDLDALSSYRLTTWETRIREGHARGNVWLGQGLSGEESNDNSFVAMFSQTGMIGGISGVLFALVVTGFFIFSDIGPWNKALWLSWMMYSTVESMWYSLGNPMSIYVWATMLTALGSSVMPKHTLSIQG